MKKSKKRGSAVSDALPWIIISIVVFALVILFILLLKGNGLSIIDKIKNLLRSG